MTARRPERRRDPAATPTVSGEYRIDPVARIVELELDRESPISASGAALGEVRLLDEELTFDEAAPSSPLDLATMRPPPFAGAPRPQVTPIAMPPALPREDASGRRAAVVIGAALALVAAAVALVELLSTLGP